MLALLVVPFAFADAGLVVRVSGLRNNQGQVGCLAFAAEDGWPSARPNAVGQALAVIQPAAPDAIAECRFEDLPAGVYAVAIMHDENGNTQLDTNLLGIPTEGYGFSNDARGVLGPPSFSAAAFSYDGGSQRVGIQARY